MEVGCRDKGTYTGTRLFGKSLDLLLIEDRERRKVLPSSVRELTDGQLLIIGGSPFAITCMKSHHSRDFTHKPSPANLTKFLS